MNSTWFESTNSVLNLAQLQPVGSTAAFDGGQLTKYQNAAKWKINLAHMYLTQRMVTAFTNAKFQLPIEQGITDYVLDTGISAESLKYESWFNITAGSAYAQYLPLMKYEDYTMQWPDQTVIYSGPPQYVVQLPYDVNLDYGNPMPRIRVFPVPDANYQLQYQARYDAYSLENSGSILLWPPAYEYGLWVWAWQFLEVDLAEGREGNLVQLVDEVISRIRVVSQSAEQVRKGVRVLKLNHRRRYRGTYFG